MLANVSQQDKPITGISLFFIGSLVLCCFCETKTLLSFLYFNTSLCLNVKRYVTAVVTGMSISELGMSSGCK